MTNRILPVQLLILLGLFFYALAGYGHGEKEVEFIPNKGQFHQNVLFKVSQGSNELFLERKRVLFHQMDYSHLDPHGGPVDMDQPRMVYRHNVFVEFENATTRSVRGVEEEDHHFYNYIIGKDKSRWAFEVYPSHTVIYDELYPGIDMVYYTHDEQIKYDLRVAPGAEPGNIKFRYRGQENIRVKGETLFIKTSLGQIVEQKPYAYQLVRGRHIEVPCSFELEDNLLTFKLGSYDPSTELVIDPTLIFSTYSGASGWNFGYTATFDSYGFLYSGSTIFGTTGTYDTTAGAFQGSFAGGVGTFGTGGTDIAITKWDTTGSSLVYSTYIGGSADEVPHSMVVNSRDELLLLGSTGSNNFPTQNNSYDTSFGGGPNTSFTGLGIAYPNGSDMIVTKFNSTGTGLLGSSYLGGTGNDGLNTSGGLRYNYADEIRGEIDVDQNDNIMIASSTNSTDFPMVGSPFQNTNNGFQEGVIVKMFGDVSGVSWSTYLGGSADDAVYSLAIRSNNDIVVTGGTVSSNFPNNINSTFPSYGGGRADGFVTHINSTGTSLIRSTFFGTNRYDQSYFVEVDKSNHVYIYGQTEQEWNILITNALYSSPGSGQFVTKLHNDLDSIHWSTRFGTSTPSNQLAQPNISPTAFLVDLCNAIYLSGWGGETNQGQGNNSTYTTGMDTTTDAYQGSTDGSDFYLMVLADDASQLKYGSFFGGGAHEHVDGGTSRFDRKGKIYQAVCAGCNGTGVTNIHDFPTTGGAYADSSGSAQCNLAVFKMDFNLPLVVADFQTPLYVCVNDTVFFQNNSLIQNQTNFVWNFGDGSPQSTVVNPTHIYSQPGDYFARLIVSDTGTCNLNDSIIKLIRVIDDTAFTIPPVHMCYGDSLQIGPIPTLSYNYLWSPATGLSDTTIANPIANPPDTTHYTLVMDNGVCIDTAYQTVFVDSSVAAIFNAPATFCLRDSFPIVNTSKDFLFTTYFWSFGNGDTSHSQNPNYTYTSPGSYTIALVVTDTFSCNQADTSFAQVVVVDDSVYSLAPRVFCPGDTFQIGITHVNFQPYHWIPSVNLSDSTIANPLAWPDSSMTYLLLRDNGACYDSIFAPLIEDSAIHARFSVPPEQCAPYTAQFINTSTFLAQTDFYWDFGGGDTSHILNPTRSYTSKGSYPIKLVVFDTAACNLADTLQLDLLIDEDSTYALDTVIVCNQQPTEIGVVPIGSYSYQWNTSLQLSDSTIANPTAVVDTFRQYLLYIDRGACVDTALQPVDLDSILADLDNDTILCSNDNGFPITFFTYGTGKEFHWSTDITFIDTLNANKTDSTVTLRPRNTFNTYHVRAWSEKGCMVEDTFLLTLGDLGLEVSQDEFICLDDTVVLSARTIIPNDTLTFLWGPGNDILGPLDSSHVAVNPLDDTEFYVRTINTIGCVSRDTILVEVSDLDSTQVDATTDRDTILVNEVAQLTADPPGFSYLWTPGHGLSDSTIFNPEADPDSTITYRLKISDPRDETCVVYDSVTVAVKELLCGLPEIFVPSGFTPNGDGLNEVAIVHGRYIREMYFAIYDRWGEKVFETEDQNIGWDGTFRNKPVSPDVFVYYLEGICLDDQDFFMKGNITLIR